MSIFKAEEDTKRVIFNIRLDLAQRLEKAKEEARMLGRKLDHESAVNKTLEKFLKKAEKRIQEELKAERIQPEKDRSRSEAAESREKEDE